MPTNSKHLIWSGSNEQSSPPPTRETSAAFSAWVARLRPLRHHVILEPAWPSLRRRSGIWRVPPFTQYPQAGWIVARGKTDEKELQLGALVILSIESTDVARLYYRVFEVMFTGDQGSAFFDPDLEPVIREAVERWRANPTTDNATIATVELNGGGIRFDASDVLTYQWAETSSGPFGLLYPISVRMFGAWFGSEAYLFYVVHEKDILGVIHA